MRVGGMDGRMVRGKGWENETGRVKKIACHERGKDG